MVELITELLSLLNESNKTLNTSDRINIALCLLSFLLSAISIVFVVLTLRQNNKMIEASTRPYISVSYKTVRLDSTTATYIMIKNYGNTGAHIDKFECNISDGGFLDHQIPQIPGTYFAPGQKLLYYFKQDDIEGDFATFEYSYTTGRKTYSEVQKIRIKTGAMTMRTNSKDASAHILQDIAEQLL